MTWQPIATAPRDGTRILARVEYRAWSKVDVSVVWFDAFIEDFIFDSLAFERIDFSLADWTVITHWQPLPSTDLGVVEGAS